MDKKKRNADLIGGMAAEVAEMYEEEAIDVVKDDETGMLQIVWHSSNNSFTPHDTGIKADDADLEELEKALDTMGIGHCW